MKKNLTPKIFLILNGLILFITTCTRDDDEEELRKESITRNLNNAISADTLESLVGWMQSMGTRFALSENHRNVAMKIKNRFKNIGYPDARIDSFMINYSYKGIIYRQWQYNIIAALKGNSNPDSVCIVGGHYDDSMGSGDPFSIVPGANDNASGVAAVIELARVMKKFKYSPRNTIEFIAFGAEELGLYGSNAYVVNAVSNSKKLKMMLNNDMIAYQPGTIKTDWLVNIMDYDNSHNLRTEAEIMCNRFSVLKYKNDNSANKQSDSYPFFRNGYEALFFFSNYIDPNYHTLNDLAASCNFDYCREIVKVNCALLVENN
jgi:hypothetical protein